VCSTTQLKITLIHGGVDAGHSGGYLAFTNEADSACHLLGWPMLTAINSAGLVSSAEDLPGGGGAAGAVPSHPQVTLPRGGSAIAFFSATDVPAVCPATYRQYALLRITPPENAGYVIIPIAFPNWQPDGGWGICPDMTISAVLDPATFGIPSSWLQGAGSTGKA
jgi:hypothetical protein